MNVYLDSSALLKLVWEERGRHELIELTERATHLSTAAIAYTEVRSGIARALRPRTAEAGAARKELDAVWPQIAILTIDETRARTGGDIADRHRLRGMDALHVSAAVELSSLAPLVFASWDKDQRNAARREGLEVFPTSI